MGMVNKADELAAAHGWFLHAPVRERGQCRHALAHDGARDSRGLQGRPARLLGHRIRHRRHAEGRRARAGEGDARTPRSWSASRPTRRCSPAAPARSARPTARRRRRIPRSSRTRCRAGRRTSSPSCIGDAVDSGVIHKILRIAGPDALRCSRDLAQKEGIFVGITAGATLAGALQVCAEAPKGSTILAHAARHRRALSEHAAVRRYPGGHDRGGAEDLPLDAGFAAAACIVRA